MRFFMFIYSIIILFFTPLWAHATADGPDYFKNKINHSVYLYKNANTQSVVLAEIPAHRDYLKNMGCIGTPTLSEWENMSENEKQQAQENIWCQVNYMMIEGWVKNMDLTEGSSIADLPMFLCDTPNLNEIETLICQDDTLKVLDYEITIVYDQAYMAAQKLGILQELEKSQQDWLKTRNNCAKAEDRKACTQTQYLERIAYLQTEWDLIKPNLKANYFCGEDKHFELTAHFYNQTAVATVKIAYNGKTDILLQKISASGARYVGIMGQLFWIKGNEAIFKPGKNTAEYQCITND